MLLCTGQLTISLYHFYPSGLGQFGQAWYVNGDLAPDLYLVRGQKYTFIVEGGLGTDQEGIIHPFYLTSDNEGGYGTKSDYEARVWRGGEMWSLLTLSYLSDGGDIRWSVPGQRRTASPCSDGPAVSLEISQSSTNLRHLPGLQVLPGRHLPGDGGAGGAEVQP